MKPRGTSGPARKLTIKDLGARKKKGRVRGGATTDPSNTPAKTPGARLVIPRWVEPCV
jgi:hypothetical protein